MAGIQSYGVALPRLRLARRTIATAMGWVNAGLAAGRGERTVCNWDEDSLTLAVEAAREALPSHSARRAVGTVALASTTLPFADRSNATLLAGALALPDSALAFDVAGSQRCGSSALAQALAVHEARDRADPAVSLVVAADARLAKPGSEQESRYGHGGAALVVGSGDGVARFLARVHVAADFVDHHRLAGESFDYSLEERWVRESGWFELVPPAIRQLLQGQALQSADVAHLVVAADPAIGRRLAALTGIAEDRLVDPLAGNCGNTGCGHALLLLAGVLERAQPGELVLVIGFGQGVDALLFRTTDAVATQRPRRGLAACLADRREEPHYTRYLAHAGLLPAEFGMRAERDSRTAQPAFWRKRAQSTAFAGGRCRVCGTVQFPLSRVCVDPACRRSDTQDPQLLAETTGQIKTLTEDWLAYSPRPPLVYGNVAFVEGGNAFMEFADFEPGEARVGGTVRFVFRLKDVDRIRGFRRYFWKAAPGRAG